MCPVPEGKNKENREETFEKKMTRLYRISERYKFTDIGSITFIKLDKLKETHL